MNRIKDNLMPLSLMISLPLLNIFYIILNGGGHGAHSLMTDLDRGLPFLKIFILPYLGWYPYLFCTLIYFCFEDRRTYYQTLLALDLGMTFCYVVYFFYQTTVPRPVMTGDDILTRMVAWVYMNDPPFNCFPSIHCLSSYLMFKGIRHSSVRKGANLLVVSFMAFTIVLSTLLVKQHTILDVVAAVFLGELLFNIVGKMSVRTGRKHCYGNNRVLPGK